MKEIKESQNIQSYQLIQELVDNIPDVIYFKDKKGRLILVNKAHAAGLGLTPKQVVGRTDFDFFPLPEAILMTKDDLRVMETGNPLVDTIEHTTQPNGSHHIVSTTKIPRKDRKGDAIGIMGITRDITERVLTEERELLERKKTEEELKSLKCQIEIEKNKLEQILGIEEQLNKIIKIDELIRFVVNKTAELLQADKCSLMLVDPKTNLLCVRGYHGMKKGVVRQFSRNGNQTISSCVFKSGTPLLVTDIEQDQRFARQNRSSYRTKSFLSVPVAEGNHVVGIINVADKHSSGEWEFTSLDLKILMTLARQVSIALENVKLYRELKYLALSDPLTNMYNYRHFANSLDHEISRMKRYKENLCLLMLDVDDFKRYNDTFGHLEGDQLLKQIGQVLHDYLRSLDIACRYAGDEFVVILPKTQILQAKIVANKITHTIAQLPLKTQMTMSIGIAEYDETMDRHQLVLNADSALYQAKKDGKNRFCCFENHKSSLPYLSQHLPS